jgi:BirA family biotin operon repressor/biotin-[acetyl-CoA-carboxylase] ligase
MKNHILQILKNSSGYVSGEIMSQQMGVTRTAIWKAIRTLRQEGYPIAAVPNRGYRLCGDADILNREEILASLQLAGLTGSINQVTFEPNLDSTNRLARQAAEQGAPDFCIFVAECQTAGRGRRGKAWLSDHRQGLWFSVLLRPRAEITDLARITLFAGLCVAEALGGFATATGIKWPNDLVAIASGRKLGGILTEMTIEENTVKSLIIGIGLNIATLEFPAELTGIATSLSLETGRSFRRVDVLAAILRVLVHRYSYFAKIETWLPDYRRLCLTLGREIQVVTVSGNSLTGLAVDLDESGELVVEDQAGQFHIVRSGEVSVRGLLGYN